MARVRRSYKGYVQVDNNAAAPVRDGDVVIGTLVLQFGVEHPDPETGVPGHSETQIRYIGVERDFDVERLVIDVE